jgi:four helix bundle protein
MGARNLNELRAFQKARAFKLEVYRLIAQSAEAQSDWKFRSQLADAAASNEMNVREGFKRWVAGEMAHFLAYAVASLEEAVGRVQDGIDRKYFKEGDCRMAFELGEASEKTTMALHKSLRPFFRGNRGRSGPDSRPHRRRSDRSHGPKTPD